MNDKYSTTEGKTSEKLSDEAMLSAQWKNIDWHKAEREVNRLQIRIVKATQQKDYNAVKRLQYLLTHSFYAKALAVKRVVTNDGRRTPGVDGVLWNTPAKKMAAALSLTDKRYRARPLRRVYIEKKDKKKKRPLGIPTMYDRAMQALYALALEPVAETTADGFLSTPSARRATAKTERKHPAFVSLYTSLHKLQRDVCKPNRKITPLLAQTAGFPVRSVPENHVCCRFALAGHQKISTLSWANSGCSPTCSTLVW